MLSATAKYQKGVGLIEVLITVLVVAIGLLSAAALQTISKKIHFEAMERSVAAQLMQDVIQKMRANSRNSGFYLVADATLVTTPSKNCTATQCDASELAKYDLFQWGQALLGASETDDENQSVGGLAFPTGCILGDTLTSQYQVVIAWRGTTAKTVESGDNTCGDGKAAYTNPDGTENTTMKRYIVVNSYIAP